MNLIKSLGVIDLKTSQNNHIIKFLIRVQDVSALNLRKIKIVAIIRKRRSMRLGEIQDKKLYIYTSGLKMLNFKTLILLTLNKTLILLEKGNTRFISTFKEKISWQKSLFYFIAKLIS